MAAALAARSTFTVREAAVLLGVSDWLAYDLIRRGDFPVQVLTLGRRTVIPKAALSAHLKEPVAAMEARLAA